MHKKVLIPLIIVGVTTVAGATLYGSFKLGKVLSKQPSCSSIQPTMHTVTVKNDVVSPEHLDARPCDKLTITNLDNKTRLMAFGQHDRHVAYDGVSEEKLAGGKSLTVTLNQEGNFIFHDHDEEEVGGTFTVKE